MLKFVNHKNSFKPLMYFNQLIKKIKISDYINLM